MTDRNTNSPHILTASATLLGLCFVVLTSINILDRKRATIIDEITAFAILFFITSSVFSFMSMKSKTRKGQRYENIADIIFFIGLFSLFITTLLITLNIIK